MSGVRRRRRVFTNVASVRTDCWRSRCVVTTRLRVAPTAGAAAVAAAGVESPVRNEAKELEANKGGKTAGEAEVVAAKPHRMLVRQLSPWRMWSPIARSPRGQPTVSLRGRRTGTE
jgi:hypothetical protein